jgi:hypothetical protein
LASQIHYYCSNKHCYALGIFAAYWAKHIAAALRIIPYTHFPMLPVLESGIHIFTDLDRLPEQARPVLAEVAERLSAAGNRVLNHPRRLEMRFGLLQAMHAAGINDFTAYRLSDWREVRRFPVFIRHADGHAKPLTDLLEGRDALRREAERLIVDRGEKSGLIVVEFGNARDRDGRFRKYSAFRVGDHHYASSMQANEHWWVKYSDGESAADKEAQAEYAAANPHREQLAPAWDAAGADYGRIDYCVVNGRVQVFEINTNPTISYLPGPKTRDHDHYAQAHETALTMLLASHGDGDCIANPEHRPVTGCRSAADVHAAVIADGKRVWRRNWIARPGPKNGARSRGERAPGLAAQRG